LVIPAIGASTTGGQSPNTCRSIDEYLADIDAAIDVLTAEEGVGWLLMNGHSTGGLTVSVHAARGRRRNAVAAVFLNSPWLDFGNVVGLQHTLLPVIAAVGKGLPGVSTPSTDRTYVESVHSSYRGEWDFDLGWKPLTGFPTWLSWIGAIRAAHGEVTRGLGIAVPVLLLRSTRSLRPQACSLVA
jgi:alpha-beta hydrolase superfamily lysophospholipase